MPKQTRDHWILPSDPAHGEWNAWDTKSDAGAGGTKEFCLAWMDRRLAEDPQGMAGGRYRIKGPDKDYTREAQLQGSMHSLVREFGVPAFLLAATEAAVDSLTGSNRGR